MPGKGKAGRQDLERLFFCILLRYNPYLLPYVVLMDLQTTPNVGQRSNKVPSAAVILYELYDR